MTEVALLSWNVFHCRDAAPSPPPDWRSTLLRTPRVRDGYIHRNRRHVAEVAAVVRTVGADVAALQEVPPGAVAEIARLTGMRALAVRTAPLVGPAVARDAIGRLAPDLVRTHEGNANVLYVAPSIVVDDLLRARHVPFSRKLALTHRRGIDRAAAVHWLLERRALIAARLTLPGGASLCVVCAHTHGGSDPRITQLEIERVAAVATRYATRHELVVAGDFNARPGDAAFAPLLAAGLRPTSTASAELRRIDHILARGCTVVDPQRGLPPDRHEVAVTHRGERLVARLSDHTPITARLRV